MSNSESGKEDGKATSGRNNTVRELIDMFERLCQNVQQDQGLRDAISKVVAAQSPSMSRPNDLLVVNAAVVADVLQKLQVSSDPGNVQQWPEQEQQEQEQEQQQEQQQQQPLPQPLQQYGEDELPQSLEAQLQSLSRRFRSSTLESTVATTSSTGPPVAVAAPHICNTRFMADTGLTREGFCQKLNELLKLHLLIQRFIRDPPTNDASASSNSQKA